MTSSSGSSQATDDLDFRWPDTTGICVVQDKHRVEAASNIIETPSSVLIVNGSAQIPNEAVVLRLWLLTIVHTGLAGHCSAKLTWHALHKELLWAEQRKSERDFVSSSLLRYY